MKLYLTAFPRLALMLFISALSVISAVQSAASQENRMVICLLPLAHADAEELVSVLTPLLSPQGTITAYGPTNTLVIKDRSHVVQMIVKAVKGRPDLSECSNWTPEPKVNRTVVNQTNS